MKRCSDCKETKAASTEEFNKSKAAKDGLSGICRACNARRVGVYQARIIAEALRVYGQARCACCGTTRTEFLMLVGSGTDGRGGSWTGGGFPMAFRLRQQGWPPGHRVLCANCRLAQSRDAEHTCLSAAA